MCIHNMRYLRTNAVLKIRRVVVADRVDRLTTIIIIIIIKKTNKAFINQKVTREGKN